MAEDKDKPSWLNNAVTKKEKPGKVNPKRKIKAKKVAKTLKNAGLTIVVDDNDPTQVIDCELDPSEEFDVIKGWAEGRALSASARVQRQAFVNEFMKDFDGVKACVRLGASDPVVMWRRLNRCAFTQRLISKHLEEWEASATVTRNKLVAVLWREANDFIHGTAATRVAAATKLGKLMGYEVDNINLNLNTSSEFVEAPLTKDEFLRMKESFDEDI